MTAPKIDITKAVAYNAKQIGDKTTPFAQLVALFQQSIDGLIVDGMFGPKTRAKLAEYIRGKPAPAPVAPDEPLSMLERELAAARAVDLPIITDPGTGLIIVDMRSNAIPKYDGKPYTALPREIGSVWGGCLHQTACSYGDVNWRRFRSTNAHFLVRRPHGLVYWIHDLKSIIPAANGYNSLTYSVEVEAMARGKLDDPSTAWKRPSLEATASQLDMTDALLCWIDDTIDALGGNQRVLVAHRQSSGTRAHDPGERIWREVAVRVQTALGLYDGGEPGHGPAFIGSGAPIPREWNPDRDVDY